MVVIDPFTNVTAEDPTTTFLADGELHPERSLNTIYPSFPNFCSKKLGCGAPALFTGYGRVRVNSAGSWDQWSSNNFSIPNIEGASGRGDPWATTSGATGLDYVSFLLDNGSTTCAAIAATTPAHRQANIWDFPAKCVTGFDGGDAPSIAYDPSGPNLWMAHRTPSGIRLIFFKGCGPGAPGTNACPITGSYEIPGASGLPVVAVNPCNHIGLMSFSGPPDQVLVNFNDPSTGKPVGNSLLMQSGSHPLDATTACLNVGFGGIVPKCASPAAISCDESPFTGLCLRLGQRAHIATQAVLDEIGAPRCFAYVGYDTSHVSHTDFKTYTRSNLDVLDITTAGKAFQVTGFRDANDFATFNAFGTVVAAPDTSTVFNTRPAGWFYYSQFGFGSSNPGAAGGDPCSTVFEGAASIDHFTSLGGITSFLVSPPFPSLRLEGVAGMGDYQGTIKRGLPQGTLYPVWHQPTKMTSGTGVDCLGAQYSMGIVATQVHVQ